MSDPICPYGCRADCAHNLNHWSRGPDGCWQFDSRGLALELEKRLTAIGLSERERLELYASGVLDSPGAIAAVRAGRIPEKWSRSTQ